MLLNWLAEFIALIGDGNVRYVQELFVLPLLMMCLVIVLCFFFSKALSRCCHAGRAALLVGVCVGP